MHNTKIAPLQYLWLVVALALIAGCSAPTRLASPIQVTAPPSATTLVSTLVPVGTPTTADPVAATLGSLQKVDDHPLYTLRYVGAYDQRAASQDTLANASTARLSATTQFEPQRHTGRQEFFFEKPVRAPAWACSLFAALGDADNPLYGRNFDWEHSPAVLLFTAPPGGHASVSMVDIAYLGFTGERANRLTELSLAERRALLKAPFLPFDGMNERGLAVGMAAVPPGNVRPDPSKETLDSLMVIRKILDNASTVEQAVAIFQRYNISLGGGPPLHYLIADRSGRAALIEYALGQLRVIPNERPWHLATNFLVSAVNNATGQCQRYDALRQRLTQTEGRLSATDATNLLHNVSQKSTQWSVVYGMSTGEIRVAMGLRYENVHAFRLGMTQ